MQISSTSLLTATIYPYHSVRAPFGPFTVVSLLLRLPRRDLSHLVSSGYIMPSADFFHVVGAGYPALSQFLPHAASQGTWKTSRGEHVSFCTWTPSIPTASTMDRGLRLVLPRTAGSLTRSSRQTASLTPVSIRHPVHLRYPASAGRPPSEVPSPTPPCTTATSFASIRLDLGLAIYRNYDIYSPIRYVPCPAHNKAMNAD
jgi:hypothetical protein